LSRWFHVGVTRRRDGTTILFVDGREVGREQTGAGQLGRGPHPLLIGASTNGPDPTRTHARFDGQMDDLAIYDRALDPGEMALLAARRQP
jgi:hypothetical protein